MMFQELSKINDWQQTTDSKTPEKTKQDRYRYRYRYRYIDIDTDIDI